MSRESYYEQTGVAMTCRSYEEYERMFALSEKELARSGPILDVAAGASSFVAEAVSAGLTAVAADPLYQLKADEIKARGMQEIEQSTDKLEKLADQLDWTYYGSLDRHRAGREASLQRFAADFRAAGSARYKAAGLPAMPFADETFGLVLCSHFLFLYEEQFSYGFHLQAVKELLRVCRPGGEVRIYPLSSLKWERYGELDRLLTDLASEGVMPRLIPSRLPFIPGSTELLQLAKP